MSVTRVEHEMRPLGLSRHAPEDRPDRDDRTRTDIGSSHPQPRRAGASGAATRLPSVILREWREAERELQSGTGGPHLEARIRALREEYGRATEAGLSQDPPTPGI